MLLLAYLCSLLARAVGLPRVVGQVLAGFVLGLPFIQPMFFTPENGPVFEFLADIGIILLFFFSGLEIDLRRFRRNAAESIAISFGNTILPLTTGYFFSSYVLGFSPAVSLLIGISLSVSSQAIALDILDEKRMLKSKLGTLVISTASLDDLLELVLISVLLVLFNVGIEQTGLGSFFLQILAFVLIILIFKWWFIPLVLRVFEQEQSRSYLFMGAFILVLFVAWLAEMLGVGSLIGAFITGVLVRYALLTGQQRRYWEEHEISRSVHTIAFGFLIPIFFVWVGVNTQIVAVFQQLPLIIPLFIIDVVGTVLGSMLAVRFIGRTWREGYQVGWGVIPKGDTELVIASLALEARLIDRRLFSAIVFVAFICTIIGPVMFKYALGKRRPK
ncbi:cation:proton antiporter [Candidatus Woesearchaeota archaeon]|nr:cation:proton antiporter [Candidatus Woesearchaeota archaeon]